MGSVNSPHATKFQRVVLDSIDAIEHQAMQMNVEIGRRTEALDERDRTDACRFSCGLRYVAVDMISESDVRSQSIDFSEQALSC